MNKFPTIPGYKIKKKIGQGGMAAVYLCIQEKLNRLVAMKLLDLEKIDNQRLAKRFIKEAKALSKLNHPNIVSIYDIGKHKNYYYIVMEYMPDSLKNRLKKEGKIKPQNALHIVFTISDALFYAHLNGVIHRDIKPENIMFRKDGSPVLLDFGIAKYIGAKTKLTKTGVSIGTPQYMSPEQCNAERLDGRSDIYSLGVVLFEMFTGKIPYTANDIFGIAMKHLKEPVPELKGKLKSYQYIIDRMMEKDKRKRLKTKKELFQIIRDLLNLETGFKTKETKERVKSKGKTINKRITKTNNKRRKKSKRKGRKRQIIIYSIIIILILILTVFFTDNPIRDWITNTLHQIKLFFKETKAQ